MPNLVYTVPDFIPFTKILSADVNSRFADIRTLLNTTGLDTTNIQQYGVARDRLALGTANHVVINSGTGEMSSEAALATTRGGTGQSLTLNLSNAGTALTVNDAGNAFALSTPSVGILTQTLGSDIATLTAGETITANDAVCLGLHNGTGSNVYRVFRCDSDIVNRRRNFIGFAVNSATVTAGIYTYTASAAFVASNVITTTINGRSYATTYASSSDATLQAVATQIATDPDVASAIVTVVGGDQVGVDDRVIVVTARGGLSLVLSAVVTLGASQPTITVVNTQAASGDAVRIRNFGLLGGFSGLTVGLLYYIGTTVGSITSNPGDPSPILVGQALTTTQLFVNTNIQNYQFESSEVFIRSGGSSINAASGGTTDTEHFNFVSWSSGTAMTAARSHSQGGSSSFNGALHVIDGQNTSATLTLTNYKYNKSTWSTETNRTTVRTKGGVSAFSGYLYVGKGWTSIAFSDAVAVLDRYNGSSWNNGVATLATQASQLGAAVQGGLIRWCGGSDTGGSGTNAHDTYNGTSTGTGTTTSAPGDNTNAVTAMNNSNAVWAGIATGATGAYFNGSAWNSTGNMTYSPNAADSANAGFATAGLNSGSTVAYVNGGENGSAVAVNTTNSLSGTTFSASTASTNSRVSGTGAVF